MTFRACVNICRADNCENPLQRLLEESRKELRMIKEENRMLEEKLRMIEEKNRIMEEKLGMMEEKNRTMQER